MAYFNYLEEEKQIKLRNIADQLATPGKGLMLLDEEKGVINARLRAMGAETTEIFRVKYWEMFLNANAEPNPLATYLSGIILSSDAIEYKNTDGDGFVNSLSQLGILIGANLAETFLLLMGTDNETTTVGLDNLHDTCKKQLNDGVKFATWKVFFRIGQCLPSPLALSGNANTIARFCSICQTNSLVPVPYIQILPFGNYDLERCQQATEEILATVYKALNDYHVFLEGTLLLASFATNGLDYDGIAYTPLAIAEATFKSIQRTVPPAVPGIALLTGPYSEEQASLNLDAVNKILTRKPWNITFGFSRGLKAKAFQTWLGNADKYTDAQQEFIQRLHINSEASKGLYIELPPVPEKKAEKKTDKKAAKGKKKK